jgi:hypothetical protein
MGLGGEELTEQAFLFTRGPEHRTAIDFALLIGRPAFVTVKQPVNEGDMELKRCAGALQQLQKPLPRRRFSELNF